MAKQAANTATAKAKKAVEKVENKAKAVVKTAAKKAESVTETVKAKLAADKVKKIVPKSLATSFAKKEDDNYTPKKISSEAALVLLRKGYSFRNGDSSLKRIGDNDYTFFNKKDRSTKHLTESEVSKLIKGLEWSWIYTY